MKLINPHLINAYLVDPRERVVSAPPCTEHSLNSLFSYLHMFLTHTFIILVVSSKPKKRVMTIADKILNKLPKKFTRQDVLEAGRELDAPYDTASGSVDRLLYQNKIERLAQGEYKKTQ